MSLKRWSAGDKVNASDLNENFKIANDFPSGDGSDGALNISSGATNIDLGGAKVVIKQYTTIDITGTGYLTFSNPHASGTIIIFYATGAVNLTSTATALINLTGLGATAGTGGAAGTPGNDGTDGTNSYFENISFIKKEDTNLTKGGKGIGGDGGGAATFGTTARLTIASLYKLGSDINKLITNLILRGISGAGGGGGGAGNSATSGAGGAGGRGAGSLIIFATGAINFTGIINASGSVGSAGATGSATCGGSGGGGGGAGGFVAILGNNTLTNTGTVNTDGGVGGAGSNVVGTASGNFGGGSGGAGGSTPFVAGFLH